MKNANIVSPTAAKIFAAWEAECRKERPRTYLGASSIGHECDAYLWLGFRGAVRESFDGRMYRLFDRGKREEAVFCDDLRRIGCEVKEFDENGGQFGVSDIGGHFKGHLDGIVRGLPESPNEWHVVEFKTHSDASFRKLCKDGVRRAKPMHYAQMTVYMGQTGLKSALYMAVDKDNDELWVERIKFDKAEYDAIMARARRIIDTVSPDRCATRRDDYRCKACPHAAVCWHDASAFVDPSVPETCRTCCHATADMEHDGAAWTCRLGHACSTNGTCKDHLILPFFVKGDVLEGDEHGIVYSFDANGKADSIVIGPRGVSVSEAKRFGPDEANGVKAVTDACPGATVSGSNSLAMKYEGPGFEACFSGSKEQMIAWNDAAFRIDFSKPKSSCESGGSRYFEYDEDWCVKVNPDGTFVVYGEKIPF